MCDDESMTAVAVPDLEARSLHSIFKGDYLGSLTYIQEAWTIF